MNNKNKSLTLIGLVLLVLSISTVVYAAEATITVNNLNVRSGPGLSYEVIAQVHADEGYQIINEEGNWVQIQVGGLNGWVSKDYVKLPSDNEPVQEIQGDENENNTVYVLYEKVNVRNGPSTDNNIIGYSEKGSSLSVINKHKDWLEVKWKGNTGFVPEWAVDESYHQPEIGGIEHKTIVIDAGHGGYDVGAIGVSGSYEKDYTFRTTMKLKDTLETLGANPVLTRETDHYYSLSGRASVSNLLKADAFLSIHYNSTPQYPNATGVSTYYYSDSDQRFAKILQSSLLTSTGMDNRGIHYASFQVLRENHRPALLLELGFLSNERQENDIKSDALQDKIVKGVISGLTTYFEQ